MNRSIFQFIVGWSIILIIVLMVNKTQWGNRAIYYTLWLSAFILILTNYQFFVDLYGTGQTPNGTISNEQGGLLS